MIKSIEIDSARVEAFAAELGDQMDFIVMTTLNRSAEDANAALRRALPERFIIRQPGLLRHVAPQQLPKTNRATKDNLTVILGTESTGRIFNPFQTGEPKISTDPLRPVAIPTSAIRPTPSFVIARKDYPTNLGLVARRDPRGTSYYALGRNAIKKKLTPFKLTAGGVMQIRGKRRTFVLDPVHHRGLKPSQWGVYQRTGPGEGDIRMLWQYTRRVSRPASLKFYETLEQAFDARVGINFDGALELALRTAR